MMVIRTAVAFAVLALLVLGCTDKASRSYVACVQADVAGDAGAAMTACADAVATDPDSVSGKAATARLKDLRSTQSKMADDATKAAPHAQARATVATPQADADKTSLCTDLEAWLPPMIAKARDLDGLWLTFTQGNKAAGDPGALWNHWAAMAEDTKTKGKQTRDDSATLKRHKIVDGEAPHLKALVEAYDILANQYLMTSDALSDQKTPKGFPRYAYVGKDIPPMKMATQNVADDVRAMQEARVNTYDIKLGT
jgi:hypothetical protein